MGGRRGAGAPPDQGASPVTHSRICGRWLPTMTSASHLRPPGSLQISPINPASVPVRRGHGLPGVAGAIRNVGVCHGTLGAQVARLPRLTRSRNCPQSGTRNGSRRTRIPAGVGGATQEVREASARHSIPKPTGDDQ